MNRVREWAEFNVAHTRHVISRQSSAVIVKVSSQYATENTQKRKTQTETNCTVNKIQHQKETRKGKR